MFEAETIINNLVIFTEKLLERKFSIDKQIAVKTDGVSDVQISIKNNESEHQSCMRVSFSYDRDAGYFLDIDSITLEFDFDAERYVTESKKYINALNSNKLIIRRKKIFGLIVKDNIEIID